MDKKVKELKAKVKKLKQGANSTRQEFKEMVFYLICDSKPLDKVAKELGITRVTIYRWAKNDPEFNDLLTEARKIQIGSLVDQCLDIAFNNDNDFIVAGDRVYPNAANVARSKLQIGTILKLAKFYHPEMFGEKAQVDVTSGGETLFTGLTIIHAKEDEEF